MAPRQGENGRRNKGTARQMTGTMSEGVEGVASTPTGNENGTVVENGPVTSRATLEVEDDSGTQHVENNDISLVPPTELAEVRARYNTPEFESFLRTQHQDVQDYIRCLKHQHQLEPRQIKRNHEDGQASKDAYELQKLKLDFAKLQTEALHSVDTFQPTCDEVITDAFEKLQKTKMVPLINLLGKTGTKLSQEDWHEQLVKAVSPRSVDFERGVHEVKNKGVQKKVLNNVVWCFLQESLFDEPLRSFGDSFALNMNHTYWELFPKPHYDTDSAVWRNITATKLEALAEKKNTTALMEELLRGLCEILATLGFDTEQIEFRKRARDMIEVGIDFARLVAKQRAIVKLTFPRVEDGKLMKAEDDELMSCLDVGSEVELSGTVWFISEPALIKWGTGSGKQLSNWICLAKANVVLA